MRIHHLNCATFCPIGRKLLNGVGSLFERARLTCHCLLIESPRGLVLIDTGLGARDLARPGKELGRLWKAVMHPALDLRETALALVTGLGYKPEDVRDIILTHLDFDHAGGMADFPHARVHVSATEHAVTTRPLSAWERRRYNPDPWAFGPRWVTHSEQGERWFGFEAIRALEGGGDEILLVPTPGHSVGHCAVAVKTAGRWLLHCGDAYFHHAEINPAGDFGPVGVKMYQQIYQADRAARVRNQARLRELARAHADEVAFINSHDPAYLGEMRPSIEGSIPAENAPEPPRWAVVAGRGAGGDDRIRSTPDDDRSRRTEPAPRSDRAGAEDGG